MHRLVFWIVTLSTSLAAHAGEFPKDWTWNDDAKHRNAHAELEGKAAPALKLSEWQNGEVKPSDMKGKVVVVDFFATWCGPCMASIPHNNELFQKYHDKGLIFIGVCTSDRGQERMADVVHARGIKYPTARDPELASLMAWHVLYFPTYAAVDRTGKVRAIGLTPERVETVVKKLLAEAPPKAGS